MTIETAGLNLTDAEQADFKNLFKYIMYQSKHPNHAQRLRGNIILSLDGNGRIKMKVESFHEIATISVNGAGTDKATMTKSS